jgi:DNA integrity scanning protein DisA with diadenylate cyclase activity
MSEINLLDTAYLVYNEYTGRYLLTAQYVSEKMGFNLQASILERGGESSAILIERFLEEASDDIYDYIHSFSIYNERQDYWIRTFDSAKKILQKAMDKQLMYSRLNGILGYSSSKDVQAQRICPKAIDVLNTVIPELGVSLLYTGA